jgi:hypothetical protein
MKRLLGIAAGALAAASVSSAFAQEGPIDVNTDTPTTPPATTPPDAPVQIDVNQQQAPPPAPVIVTQPAPEPVVIEKPVDRPVYVPTPVAVAPQPPIVEGEPAYTRGRVRAPRYAFEIGLNTGYTQGFGRIGDRIEDAVDDEELGGSRDVADVADAGFAVGLGLGYRSSPHFAIGWAGQYQEFSPDTRLISGSNVRGMTTGLDLGIHFAPYMRVDPVLGLGAGYRAMWIVPDGPDNNRMLHGFQLAKVSLGLDIRASDSVAIGPMIGADLDMFVWENPEGSRGDVELPEKNVSSFIYAGVQGRFDVGGLREYSPPVTVIGSNEY